MIILHYLLKVNPEETEKEVYNEALHAGLDEFLWHISPNKENFELQRTSQGILFHAQKVGVGNSVQYRCSHNVPFQLAADPKPKKEEKRKRKDKKLLYPSIFDYCKNGGALRQIIFHCLQKFVKTWIYICSWIEGKYRAFLCNAKGTPAYCKKKYWLIHDFCKKCDESYHYKYFLTLTMSQREYGTDLEAAWHKFNNEVARFLKWWNSCFSGDYACALEAHKSGFPHAHIVLYTNFNANDPKEQYDKFKKTVCLCSGFMFDQVNKHWQLGINVLKVNYRKNTCDYLAKYISKATEADLRNCTVSDLKNDSKLKEVLTMLLPMIFSIREFKLSKGRFNKKVSAEEIKSVELLESLSDEDTSPKNEDYSLSSEQGEALRAILKTLCTKLPPSCMKNCYQMSTLDFKALKPLKPEDLERLPIHRNIKIAESGKRISCKGCNRSATMDFICHGNMKMFDVARNWEIIASLSNWHYSRINDKSVGLHGEEKKKAIKQYEELNYWRDTFFEKVNFSNFWKNILGKIDFQIHKDIPYSELQEFLIACYSVNPMIARYVLKKRWWKVYEFYNVHKKDVVSKLSPEEKQLYKEVCSQIFSRLTNSASGIIIEE